MVISVVSSKVSVWLFEQGRAYYKISLFPTVYTVKVYIWKRFGFMKPKYMKPKKMDKLTFTLDRWQILLKYSFFYNNLVN